MFSGADALHEVAAEIPESQRCRIMQSPARRGVGFIASVAVSYVCSRGSRHLTSTSTIIRIPTLRAFASGVRSADAGR